VDPAFQGRGIGTRLIELTTQKARALGYRSLSLICFADNSQALHVYDRVGFEMVRQVPMERDKLIPHEGGCLLLKCSIP